MEEDKFYAELPPIHPGEILREEYLKPLALSAGALAKRLGVPRTRIERLVAEETSVTIDTALRLGRFFGTSPDLWMSMQTGYDFKIASVEKAETLKAITPLEAA
jgi:addiction module HigA family antidote